MAFGGRELRLILSIQSYGTSNFARLRRDITTLERTTALANRNQLAVQNEMVRKAGQLAKTQDRIASLETAAVNRRMSLQGRAARLELQFAARRQAVQQRELRLADALAVKRLQIARSEDRLGQMRGSAMQRFSVQEAQLAGRRLNIQNSINSLEAQGIGLEAQSLRNQAQRLSAFRNLAKVAGGAARASAIAADIDKAQGTRVKELALRYNAVRKDTERIAKIQGSLPGLIAAQQQQLAVVAEQEQLISAQKFEQAAAVGRQAELVAVQQGQLQAIEARQAQIAIEVGAIDKQEALVNAELAQQLALLEKENVQLERARILAAEQSAEFKRLGTIRMTEAMQADALLAKQRRLQEQEIRARSAAHVGRAAQFTGLLGTAAVALAATRFAGFNREAAKAATQMRDVGASFDSTAGLTDKLQKRILILTRRFPASADEMAAASYEIASGMDLQGTSAERLSKTMDILEAANKAAVAGGVDLESATKAVVTVLNNFDPEARNVNRTLNQMFAIVRFGRGDFQQFEQVFGKISAAAKSSGQTLLQAGGAAAFLTTKLGSQAQAATALTRLLQIMARPEFIKGFEKIFKVPATIGTGPEARLKRLSDIIGIIVRSTPQLTKGGIALQNLIPIITAAGGKPGGVGLQSTEMARKALVLLVTGWKQYADVLGNVINDQDEADVAFERMQQTLGVRWEIAINQFKAFAIIVGEQVLPVMLKVTDALVKAVHWFGNLPEPVRHSIGQFAAWGSVLLLVGGTLIAIVGSIRAVHASLLGMASILGTSRGEATVLGKTALLLTILRKLAALGVIVLTIKVLRGGDPSAWELLGAAASGALLGSRFGPIGAAVGAVTIPVGIQLIADFKKSDAEIIDKANKQSRSFTGTLKRIWHSPREVVARLKWTFKSDHEKALERTRLAAEMALRNNRIGTIGEDVARGLDPLIFKNKKTTQTILEQWRDLATQLTGLGVFENLSKQAAAIGTEFALKMAKAQASGNQAAIRAAAQAQINFDLKQIARLEKLPSTPERREQLIELYNNIAQMNGLLQKEAKANDAAAKAQERHQRAIEKANNALETAQQRLQQAKLRLKELQDAAKQTLQGAFGQIFQGPLAQGPIGQTFQNIAQTLMGFGQVFKIPAQFTLGDQAAQQKMFDQLTGDIALLQKRAGKKGIPQFALEDILQQGTGALPFLEGILRTPGATQQFIAGLRRREAAVGAAAESPWNKQLTAANIQLQAAQIQLRIAQNRVKTAKTNVTTVHNETTNVHPSADAAVTKYLKQKDFQRRTKARKK